MSPISRLHFTLLFFALLFPSFCADGESHPTLTVGQSAVYLYATHGGDSETITKLEEGEKLTLLARAVSKGSWYMVKTQKGTVGWVRSSDVKESNRLEKTFEETASLPSPAFPANELPPPSGTTSKGASTVSVEMTGSSLVVPVVLARRVFPRRAVVRQGSLDRCRRGGRRGDDWHGGAREPRRRHKRRRGR